MLPWPARLLMRLVPDARRPDLTGDLAEVHARRRARGSAAGAWLRTVGDAVSAVLFLVALLARLVPALRATRVSPMRAMGDG